MEPIVQVSHLVKRYKKAERPAVDDVSFEVRQGELFAFLGPNGAGKTTTISILTTTLAKSGGSVKIAGYDLEKEAKQVRRNVGIIFQNPSLDPELTAEENIRLHASIYGLFGYMPFYRLMPAAYKKRIGELAEVVGIQDNLFKKTKTFSGGMKRKLEIVRSLMHNPKVLFLDEPTQGLDAASRRGLWTYLRQVREEEKITIFLTTHYLDEAEGADRVCMINKGKIAMLGTPDEIKSRLTMEKYMLLDAHDREALKRELAGMNAVYEETDRGLRVAFREQTPQRMLSEFATPLSRLDVHQPTLEEAYLDLIEPAKGRGAS